MNIWGNGEFWARCYFKAMRPVSSGGWPNYVLPLNLDGEDHEFYVAKVTHEMGKVPSNKDGSIDRDKIDRGTVTASYMVDNKFDVVLTFSFTRVRTTKEKQLGMAFAIVPFTVVDCEIINYTLKLAGSTTQDEVDYIMMMVLLQGDVYD